MRIKNAEYAGCIPDFQNITPIFSIAQCRNMNAERMGKQLSRAVGQTFVLGNQADFISPEHIGKQQDTIALRQYAAAFIHRLDAQLFFYLL